MKRIVVERINIPYGLMIIKELNWNDKSLLSLIFQIQNESDFTNATNEYLTHHTGLSESTVKRSLTKLTKLGYITYETYTPKGDFKTRKKLRVVKFAEFYHVKNDYQPSSGQNELMEKIPSGQNELMDSTGQIELMDKNAKNEDSHQVKLNSNSINNNNINNIVEDSIIKKDNNKIESIGGQNELMENEEMIIIDGISRPKDYNQLPF